MKNLLLATFKWYNVNPISIRSSIINREFVLLSLILKRYRSRDRALVLEHLQTTNISHPALIRQLLRLVRKDFLNNAQVAMRILNECVSMGRFAQKIREANEVLTERLRRRKNKKQVYTTHKPSIIVDTLVDKSKMKNLERVKQQLKKSIRFY